MARTGKKIVVIGSGFAGLSAACCLAQAGHEVTVIEKNTEPGGRACRWTQDGYQFDMGPSWYWMPDVFEAFFNRFGQSVSDFYSLTRIAPSYRVVFGPDEHMDIPVETKALEALFESRQAGGGQALRHFLQQAREHYRIGMTDFVYRPGLSITEFLEPRLALHALRLHLFQSLRQHVRKPFTDPQLRALLEFPVLFLGATSASIPAFYSLMNYADLVLGTWYPEGGMATIVDAMMSLARSLGVSFSFDNEVTAIRLRNGRADAVQTRDGSVAADVVVSGADYHHTEQTLLPPEARQYSPSYWHRRVMSPSSLLFYLGLDTNVDRLLHHTLFFDRPLDPHAAAIYDRPSWPEDPQFYVSCTSKTDPLAAPADGENLVILMPVACGLEDTDEIRERYYDHIMDRLERHTGQPLRSHVRVKRSVAHRDFIRDYHAFWGNAYGLANTLRQTAILKPRMRSRRVRNLYFTGQLTVPGPGVPPSLISGQVVSDLIQRDL